MLERSGPRDSHTSPEGSRSRTNLPLNRGRFMRIGCGLRVHRIDGNEYLYFWHYERENGRSRRREDYVGPARDPASKQNGGGEVLAYYRRSQTHLSSRGCPLEPSAAARWSVPFFPPFYPFTEGGL